MGGKSVHARRDTFRDSRRCFRVITRDILRLLFEVLKRAPKPPNLHRVFVFRSVGAQYHLLSNPGSSWDPARASTEDLPVLAMIGEDIARRKASRINYDDTLTDLMDVFEDEAFRAVIDEDAYSI
jgi:hypothetical protein